jgi:hypothetical protein
MKLGKPFHSSLKHWHWCPSFKTFFFVPDEKALQAGVFVHGKPLKPSLFLAFMESSTKLKRLFLASLSSLVESNDTDVNVTLP